MAHYENDSVVAARRGCARVCLCDYARAKAKEKRREEGRRWRRKRRRSARLRLYMYTNDSYQWFDTWAACVGNVFSIHCHLIVRLFALLLLSLCAVSTWNSAQLFIHLIVDFRWFVTNRQIYLFATARYSMADKAEPATEWRTKDLQ